MPLAVDWDGLSLASQNGGTYVSESRPRNFHREGLSSESTVKQGLSSRDLMALSPLQLIVLLSKRFIVVLQGQSTLPLHSGRGLTFIVHIIALVATTLAHHAYRSPSITLQMSIR
jgi:hypothetical protein